MIDILLFGVLIAFVIYCGRKRMRAKREEQERLDELWDQGYRWKGCKEDWILKDK
jgi:hypothetical protein